MHDGDETKGRTYLSGDTSLNSERFSGLTCARREAVRTNCPTELANLRSRSAQPTTATATTYPAKKALKGKLVTRTQYTNWITPERMMNTKNASMNLRRSGVCCKYDFHNADTVCDTPEGAVFEEVFGPAILLRGASTWNWPEGGLLELADFRKRKSSLKQSRSSKKSKSKVYFRAHSSIARRTQTPLQTIFLSSRS